MLLGPRLTTSVTFHPIIKGMGVVCHTVPNPRRTRPAQPSDSIAIVAFHPIISGRIYRLLQPPRTKKDNSRLKPGGCYNCRFCVPVNVACRPILRGARAVCHVSVLVKFGVQGVMPRGCYISSDHQNSDQMSLWTTLAAEGGTVLVWHCSRLALFSFGTVLVWHCFCCGGDARAAPTARSQPHSPTARSQPHSPMV